MKALLGLELLPLDSAALERSPHPAAQSSLEKTITYHSENPGGVARGERVWF